MSQKLRGLVGQGMVARRPNAPAQEPYSFPARTAAYVFTPPVAGYWKFIGWGAGGTQAPGSFSGGSGAYFEVTKFLTPARPVSVLTGFTDVSVTFANGSVATAGGASGITAGVASGGDLNINGTNGSTTGSFAGQPGLGSGGGLGGAAGGGQSGGAGAPGKLPYRGGNGGGNSIAPGIGGGAGENTTTSGQSLILAVFIKA